MGLFSWILVGAIAGWLANVITGNRENDRGCCLNTIIGMVGGVVGGAVFNFLGGAGITGFNIYSIIVAAIGAIIVLALARVIVRRP